ncbi:MAG: aspartyl/asparaginyl beta-hydroxylase domain-containing protein [Pseudomonadota bacterium]
MDIGVPIKELGNVDMQKLADTVLSLDDAAWEAEDIRQKKFSDVHYDTQSVIAIFCDHDHWPNVDVVKGAGWDILAESAVPLMRDIIKNHYPKGGTIIRAMAAKLKAGAHIDSHRDGHLSFHHGHRIHIPITTNNQVRFLIEGRPYKMQVGQAYEINNQMRHGVMNRGREPRIHFIFDYVPSTTLMQIDEASIAAQ